MSDETKETSAGIELAQGCGCFLIIIGLAIASNFAVFMSSLERIFSR